MTTLIGSAVSNLYRFNNSVSARPDVPTAWDAETSGKGMHLENPVDTPSVQTGLCRAWGQSVFRWFLGPVYAASTLPNDAPKEPGTASKKRRDYITWDEYFMGMAVMSAKRSKDPRGQVGACIVNKDKKIVGTGYNGMPIGCSDDDMPWGKDPGLHDKLLYVCHAEMNAIVNKMEADVRGCTIYVNRFPCNECAKLIVQSGIEGVVYYEDPHPDRADTVASKKILDIAGIRYREYLKQTNRNEILVNFGDPKKN